MADSSFTATGNLGFDVDPPRGNGPYRMRVALYAGKDRAGEKMTWWTTVKFFPDAFDGVPEEDLTRGTRVRFIDARVDGVWTDKNGQEQVDFLAERVELAPWEGEGQARGAKASTPARRRPVAPVPTYDEEPF